MTEAAGRPFIRDDVTDTSPEAVITTRDEDCLEFKNLQETKCIVGSQNRFEYWCGEHIIPLESSSRIVETGNNICLPGLRENYNTF